MKNFSELFKKQLASKQPATEADIELIRESRRKHYSGAQLEEKLEELKNCVGAKLVFYLIEQPTPTHECNVSILKDWDINFGKLHEVLADYTFEDSELAADMPRFIHNSLLPRKPQ